MAFAFRRLLFKTSTNYGRLMSANELGKTSVLITTPDVQTANRWLNTASTPRLQQQKLAAVSPAVEDVEEELLLSVPNNDGFQPKPYQGRSYASIVDIRKRNVHPAITLYYKQPLLLTQGRMQYLFDHTGKRYLDCLAGILTISVGHCHPKVTEALVKQANTLWHTTNTVMHPKLHEYVEKLVKKLPDPLDTVYLVNSGSEANDLAMFMAREYTRRNDIVTMQQSYHGMVSSIMGLTNLASYRYDSPSSAGVQRLITPDPYKGPWGGNKCRDSPCQPNNRTCDCAADACQAGEMYARQLEMLLDTCTPKGGVAGMFLEPIMGVAGVMQFPKNFVARAYELIRARGGLCISDEVQTGFGRLGSHFWGFQTHGVVPDIVTMAKGIGNGFPLAAVVTTKEIAQCMTKAYHFNTFGGNPLSSAVGSAVLDAIEEDGTQQNSAQVGTYMIKRLEELRTKYDVVGDVRGKGLMMGVELIDPGQRNNQDEPMTQSDMVYFKAPRPLQREICIDVYEKTKDYGLLIGCGGLKGNIFRLTPPMCVTREDADFAVEVFEKAIKEVCY